MDENQEYKVAISIIMPAYNAGKYIAESIESVIAQSFSSWELIIVDDGSTDNTANVIKKYQEKDSRIHYFYQENARQAKARNLGIEKSTANLIAFLDSDDLWLPQKLEITLKEFDEDTQDVLYTNAYVLDGASTDLELNTTIGANPGLFQGREGILEFLRDNQIPILTVIAKKDAILSVGGFRVESDGKAEDYELWLNLLASGYTIRGISNALSLYRLHSESTSSTNNMLLNVVLMLQRFFDEHKEFSKDFKPEIFNWYKQAAQSVRTKKEVLLLFNRRNLKTFGFDTAESNMIELFRRFIPEKYLRKFLCRNIFSVENRIK